MRKMRTDYRKIPVLSLNGIGRDGKPSTCCNVFMKPSNGDWLNLELQGFALWEYGTKQGNKINWSGKFIDSSNSETFSMTPSCIGDIVGMDINHEISNCWESVDGRNALTLARREYNDIILDCYIRLGKKIEKKYDWIRCCASLNNGELVYLKEVLKTAIPMLAFGKWPKDSD